MRSKGGKTKGANQGTWWFFLLDVTKSNREKRQIWHTRVLPFAALQSCPSINLKINAPIRVLCLASRSSFLTMMRCCADVPHWVTDNLTMICKHCSMHAKYTPGLKP
jgi:hypothetical protein